MRHVRQPFMRQQLWGSTWILLSASGFGFMGIFAKFAYEEGIDVGSLLFLRFSIAALLFWGWISLKGQPARIRAKDCTALGFMGAGYALMAVLLFLSFSKIPVSLAELSFYSYPVIVCVLAHCFLGQVIRRLKWLSIAFASLGLVFVLGTSLQAANLQGILLALSSGATYAVYILSSEKILSRTTPLASSAYITSYAAIALLGFGLCRGGIALPHTSSGWLAVSGVAVFSTFMAIFFFSAGVQQIGGAGSAVLSLFEPVVAVVMGAALFHEWLGLPQIVGAALIVGGIVLLQLKPLGL